MTQNIIIGNENYVEATNSVKEQEIVLAIRTETEFAQKILIQTAINIGKKLTEAKSLIKHGEWENWLKERVSFSNRTATNLMKVYKEYEQTGFASNPQLIADLNYTQAVELLALPVDSRKQLIEENNIKDMTIVELKETIKSIKNENALASDEVKKLKVEKESLTKQNAEKEKNLNSLSDRISQLKKQQQEAVKNQNKELEARLEKSIKAEQEKITYLEKEKADLSEQIKSLATAQKEAVAKVREEEQQKSDKLLQKKAKELETATNRFKSQIEKIKKQNKEQKEKVKEAEGKANLAKDLVKSEVLLSSIEANYEELTIILKRVKRSYPDNVSEIEAALAEVLKIMQKRAGLHIAS